MIHYHGLPITPSDVAETVAMNSHCFVSYKNPEQLLIAAECCQSFAVDNGAFSFWIKGEPVTDWGGYYDFISKTMLFPNFDFAVIPDVIDGSEAENDELCYEWCAKFPTHVGAPVWHLHESFERLERLMSLFPRVCLGSSGDYKTVGTHHWWNRMQRAMKVLCDADGRPKVKFHGLRMLDITIFTAFPFSSADSTNIARNIGIDSRWKGSYTPIPKRVRALIIKDRIERHNSPSAYVHRPQNVGIFQLLG